MITVVAPITAVVKVDRGYDRRHDELVAKLDALLARIEEVLVQRKTFDSASDWCRKAGLSRSYIGALRNRGGSRGTGEVKTVKHEEIAKLAKVAGVDVEWLMGEDTTHAEAAREGLEAALGTFDWPDSLTAPDAMEVLARARAEARALADDVLPISFWLKRLARIAADVSDGAAPAQSSREQPKTRRAR